MQVGYYDILIKIILRKKGVRPLVCGRFTTCYSNEWITTPERSFGSNHVVFGGIILPVSAMLISWRIETG